MSAEMSQGIIGYCSSFQPRYQPISDTDHIDLIMDDFLSHNFNGAIFVANLEFEIGDNQCPKLTKRISYF